MADFIVIDGNTYDVPVMSMKRKGEFLYKYAERTMDGKLHSELIGVYFNYQIQFGVATMAAYATLWAKLTEPTEFHTITVPDEDGSHTYAAYFSNVADEFVKVEGSNRFLKNLTVNFIAQEPART